MRTKLLLTAFLLVNTGFFLACGTGYTEPSSNSNNGSNNQGSISTSDSAENQVTAATEASGTSFTASKTIYVNLTDKKYSENNTDFTVISTTKALVLNSTASIKLGIDSDGNPTDVIRIDVSDVTSNTSIVFTGTLTTGGVKIQTGKTYETGLTLKDCSITSSNYPCIECTKKGSISVKLEGTNTLTDGRFYGTGYGEEYSTTSGVTYTDDDGVVWYAAGDIVISIDTLLTNCTEFAVTLNEELKRLLVHGILHLNGMDHSDNSPEQEMLIFQEKLLKEMEN